MSSLPLFIYFHTVYHLIFNNGMGVVSFADVSISFFFFSLLICKSRFVCYEISLDISVAIPRLLRHPPVCDPLALFFFF